MPFLLSSLQLLQALTYSEVLVGVVSPNDVPSPKLKNETL